MLKNLKQIASLSPEKRLPVEQRILEKYGKKYLKLKHVKIENTWYWKCPVCEKLLAGVKIKEHGYLWKHMANMQSKGAASRHLMTHDLCLVKHGRSAEDAIARKSFLTFTEEEIQELKQNGKLTKEIPLGKVQRKVTGVSEKGKPFGIIGIDMNFSQTYNKYYPNGYSIEENFNMHSTKTLWICDITLLKDEKV